jgi:hypothetical protein
VTRRERQQRQIETELYAGRWAQVMVMARDHLAEFPDDVEVRLAAEVAAAAIAAAEPEA